MILPAAIRVLRESTNVPTSLAKIIGSITDEWGGDWDVRSKHAVNGSLVLHQGWPRGVPRGKGGAGRPRWIMTPVLAALYRSFDPRDCFPEMRSLGLPFGENTFKKHRRLLGLDRMSVSEAWWIARIDDLASLSLEDFSKRHGVSPKTVSAWRTRLNLDRRHGVAGWWAEPDNAPLLTSETLPLSWLAEHFGVSVSWIVQVRSMLRRSGVEVDDRRGRKPL